MINKCRRNLIIVLDHQWYTKLLCYRQPSGPSLGYGTLHPLMQGASYLLATHDHSELCHISVCTSV